MSSFFAETRSRRGRSRRSRGGSGSYGLGTTGFSPTELSPEDLLALQQRLAQVDLRRQPQGEDQGFIGSALDRVFPDVLGKAISQIASALIYTPAGLVELGKQSGRDIFDLVREGDITPERSGQLGVEMGRAVYEDFRHPLRNPGYLALDVLGLASGGASLYQRGAAGLGGVAANRAARATPFIPPGEDLPPPRGGPPPPPPAPAPRPAGPTQQNPTPITPRPRFPKSFVPTPGGLREKLDALRGRVDAGDLEGAQAVADDVYGFIEAGPLTNQTLNMTLTQAAGGPGGRLQAMEELITGAATRRGEQKRAEELVTQVETPVETQQPLFPSTPDYSPLQMPLPTEAGGGSFNEFLRSLRGLEETGPYARMDLGQLLSEMRRLEQAGQKLDPSSYTRLEQALRQKEFERGSEAPIPGVIEELLEAAPKARKGEKPPPEITPAAAEMWRMMGPEDFLESVREMLRFPDAPEWQQLRAIGEGAPSGLAAQRAQVARQATAGAKEAATLDEQLRRAGFRPDLASRAIPHGPGGEVKIATEIDDAYRFKPFTRQSDPGAIGFITDKANNPSRHRIEVRKASKLDLMEDWKLLPKEIRQRRQEQAELGAQRSQRAPARPGDENVPEGKAWFYPPGTIPPGGEVFRVFVNGKPVVGRVRNTVWEEVPTGEVHPITGEPLTELGERAVVSDKEGPLMRDEPINITNQRDAERLAKMTAYELDQGVPMNETSLARGAHVMGTLPGDVRVTMEEAAALGAQKALQAMQKSRDEARKQKQFEASIAAGKEPRKRGKDDPEEIDLDEDLEEIDLEEPEEIDLEEVEEIDLEELEEVEPSDAELREIETGYRAEIPKDTPMEETPPVSRERVELAKKEAIPEELHELVDDTVERLAAQQAKEQRNLRTSGTRMFGESKRQLGINPRAWERTGRPAKEADVLWRPLRELYEGTPLRTPEEVQEVIRDTLNVDDAEAKRIFDITVGAAKAKRGGGAEKVAPEEQVHFTQGRLEELFGRVFDDPKQQAEASARYKARASEYFKSVGGRRQAKLSDLKQILEDEFGPELGGRLAGELYRQRPSGLGIVHPAMQGGGQSDVSIFFREFFRPQPRKSIILTQTSRVEETRLTGVGKYKREYKIPVDKTESAIVDLSRNPLREGFQRWYFNWLNQAPTEPTTRTERLASSLRARKIKFEKDEVARLEDYLSKAGWTREEIEQAKQLTRKTTPVDWLDTANQLTQIGVLYLKPAYVPPNLLGQILFTTIDHAWNPIAIARSFKMHRQLAALDPSYVDKGRAGMGAGPVMGIAPEHGAVRWARQAHGKLASGYSRILDNPWRDAALMNEMWKEGKRTPQAIAELMDAVPGSAEYDKLLQIYRNANRNLVDFGRLNKLEKRALRRVIFFYPWIKGSTVWAGRTAFEHPLQVMAMSQLARQGEEEAREILGEVPSYMRGIIPIPGLDREIPGIGKVPRVINPLSFSVTASGGEFLNSLKAFLAGGTSSEQLSEYLNPLITGLIAMGTRTDPFTGKTYNQGEAPWDIFLKEIGQSVPLIRGASNIPGVADVLGVEPGKAEAIRTGKLDPAESLLPTTHLEELGRFLGGTTPITYNVQEGQERAVAEDLELRSKGEAARIRWQQKTKASIEAARSAGAIGPNESFPDYVMQALKQASEREREYELLASSKGMNESDLKQIDRLQADLSMLVRNGTFTQAQAQTLLLQYAAGSDSTISQFRRRLREGYFGTKALYGYRDLLRAQGVDETILRGWEV